MGLNACSAWSLHGKGAASAYIVRAGFALQSSHGCYLMTSYLGCLGLGHALRPIITEALVTAAWYRPVYFRLVFVPPFRGMTVETLYIFLPIIFCLLSCFCLLFSFFSFFFIFFGMRSPRFLLQLVQYNVCIWYVLYVGWFRFYFLVWGVRVVAHNINICRLFSLTSELLVLVVTLSSI